MIVTLLARAGRAYAEWVNAKTWRGALVLAACALLVMTADGWR